MRCLVVRFEHQTLRFPIPEREAQIGASESNDYVVPFPGVSRVHARVTPAGNGVTLTDLGSKNRLIVAGVAHDQVVLEEGTAVQIGRAWLTVEDASTSDVEIALATRGSDRPSEAKSETGSLHSTGTVLRSPASALSLVREMELAGERRIQRNRQKFLAKARHLLDARMLLVVDLTDPHDLALVAVEGGLPENGLLSELSAHCRQRKEGESIESISGERTAFVAGSRAGSRHRCLAAVFSHPRRMDPWERDFFDYLTRRLLPEIVERPEPEEIAESPYPLAIPPGMVVGDSTAMHDLLTQMAPTVKSRIDVLLLGETGTGKELFARMIHASGPSGKGPFVAINCAAIPNELLEAELFGVVGRVATGVDPRPGLFVQAHGGSIFLDEVGELAEQLQAKLLRVLQEREVLPLGSPTPRKIDVRVIAASNRDLLERTREGKFRSDLYYRLRGLQFHIPPLRDRKEDIPPLVLAFVTRAAEEFGKQIHGVSRKALALLMEHSWPGNVRELQNEVNRAVLLCVTGGTLQAEHFAPVRWAIAHPGVEDHGRPPAAGQLRHQDEPAGELQAQVDAVERAAIEKALAAANGNKSLAARILGITRNGLALKMRRLKIEEHE